MAVKSNYNSAAPYAFVSYSHRDEVVLDIVEVVQELFNLWWDDQLIPGDRWDSEKVIPAIVGCKCVLAFYSENYVQSEACQSEIRTALEHGKKIIPVSVEGVSLAEIVKKIEEELVGTEKLHKVHEMCNDIGGGKQSASGNKVIFISLDNKNCLTDFRKVLEHYLKPEVYIRDWLESSYQYRITQRLDVLIDDFGDYYTIAQLDDEEAADYADGTNTYSDIIPLLARFKYALKHKFKNTDYPDDDINEIIDEMCSEYGIEDYYDSFDCGDFAAILYNCVTEIPNLREYMEMNNDGVSDESCGDFRKDVVDWMNSKNFDCNGIPFEPDPYSSFSYENFVGYVNVMEKFMMYIEYTYPKVIKLLSM